MVNQVDSKVSDLDQRLKRFSGLLAETFEAAEGRARDIARVLAEASTEGTRAIANQYELVRVTSDEERKRTTEALTAVYEQASGETHGGESIIGRWRCSPASTSSSPGSSPIAPSPTASRKSPGAKAPRSR